jgi:hypothetical protein
MLDAALNTTRRWWKRSGLLEFPRRLLHVTIITDVIEQCKSVKSGPRAKLAPCSVRYVLSRHLALLMST